MSKITFTEILVEKAKREKKYFKNYIFWARKIKKVAKELFGEARVFVFGSILRKDEIPRDIDILIVSPKFKGSEEKIKANLEIKKKLGFSSPFEFHFASPKEYSEWYEHFIKEKIEV